MSAVHRSCRTGPCSRCGLRGSGDLGLPDPLHQKSGSLSQIAGQLPERLRLDELLARQFQHLPRDVKMTFVTNYLSNERWADGSLPSAQYLREVECAGAGILESRVEREERGSRFVPIAQNISLSTIDSIELDLNQARCLFAAAII
jgi:hypothetical protein